MVPPAGLRLKLGVGYNRTRFTKIFEHEASIGITPMGSVTIGNQFPATASTVQIIWVSFTYRFAHSMFENTTD